MNIIFHITHHCIETFVALVTFPNLSLDLFSIELYVTHFKYVNIYLLSSVPSYLTERRGKGNGYTFSLFGCFKN